MKIHKGHIHEIFFFINPEKKMFIQTHFRFYDRFFFSSFVWYILNWRRQGILYEHFSMEYIIQVVENSMSISTFVAHVFPFSWITMPLYDFFIYIKYIYMCYLEFFFFFCISRNLGTQAEEKATNFEIH